jgi:hypothetical protein
LIQAGSGVLRAVLVVGLPALLACGVRNGLLIDQPDAGSAPEDGGGTAGDGSSSFAIHSDWCNPRECPRVEITFAGGGGHIECGVSFTARQDIGNCGDVVNDAPTRVVLQLGDAEGPDMDLEPLDEVWTEPGMPPDGWQELEFYVPWSRFPEGAGEEFFDMYVVIDPDDLIDECVEDETFSWQLDSC